MGDGYGMWQGRANDTEQDTASDDCSVRMVPMSRHSDSQRGLCVVLSVRGTGINSLACFFEELNRYNFYNISVLQTTPTRLSAHPVGRKTSIQAHQAHRRTAPLRDCRNCSVPQGRSFVRPAIRTAHIYASMVGVKRKMRLTGRLSGFCQPAHTPHTSVCVCVCLSASQPAPGQITSPSPSLRIHHR